MQVLETFLKGKRPEPSKCEDGFIVTEDYAVVIDGATAKSDLTIGGESTGRYIMELIKGSIPYISEKLDSVSFVREVEKRVLENYKKDNVYERMVNEKQSVPEAQMVVYSKFRKELWLFGDAQAMMDGLHIENRKYVDDLTAAVRRYVNEYYLINGKSEKDLLKEDEGSKAIQALLNKQSSFSNYQFDSPFSYACVTGFGINEKQIKVIPVPESTKEIVLATDGYTKLFMNVNDTEYQLNELNKKARCVSKKIVR